MSTSLAGLQPGAVLVIPWDGECPVLLLVRRGATPHHESCTLTVVNPGVAALPYHATDGRAPPKLKLRSCLELGGVPLARPHHALHLAYISPISRPYLVYISPISRPHLAYISPISRLHLAHISPTSRPHLAHDSPRAGGAGP